MDIAKEMDSRKRYYRIDETDGERMREVRDVAKQHMSDVIESFYRHLLANPETAVHFQSTKHLDAVKGLQSRYFMGLFDGVYNEQYGENRLRVGKAHERIGLGPQWYIGAYSLYLCQMLPLVMQHFATDLDHGIETFQSVIKVICMDMGIAIDTYIGAVLEREDQTQTFIRALNDFSSNLMGASSSIQSTTSAQTAAAQEQATAVAEVTSTLSELRHTSAQALEKAEAVIAGAERSIDTSKLGSQAVEAAIQGMQEIREQVEAIAEKILSLSEQSQKIGDIIASVNEIAEQSKLLALNAAIEAARAGEHGRGFAVVAAEIRSLADQSKQATGQVRKIIGDIQGATNSAVIATEEGTKRVETGVMLANRAGENIRALATSIVQSAEAARLIANAARQQSAGIQQVADAMVSINDAITNSVGGLSETEGAARKLTEMTKNMTNMVEAFSNRKAKVAEYRYV
ncbi:MAG: globin-coupled sensor protein [Polyangiaceae bacterium]|nr:globin-coupled sensor protein [Polyangiaceae bacterium]